MRRYWVGWGLSVLLLVGCSNDTEQVVQHLRNENAKLKQTTDSLQVTCAQLKEVVKQHEKYETQICSQIQEKDESLGRLTEEVQELKRGTAVLQEPKELMQLDYNPQAVFPEAVPFAYGAWLSLNRGLVSQIKFTSTAAYARYENASAQRVKPDVIIWLLNSDGVVLEKLTDTWLFESIKPGQSYQQSWSFFCSMPEELVFSKWARVAWDPNPAYVIVAGSKSAYDELLSRARTEIKRLNRQ